MASLVHDLRSTLVFALVAATTLFSGLEEYASGAPSEDWIASVSAGAVLGFLLVDGIQRRWRGDPRTRTAEPDRRTTATTGVAFGALVLVGAWSYASGHGVLTWAGSLAVGLFGAVSSIRDYRRLDPDPQPD